MIDLPGGYDVKKITDLVRSYREKDKELAEARALAERLPEEIKSINRESARGGIDEKTASALNIKRTQLSMCPARIESLQEVLDELDRIIENELGPLQKCCWAIFDQETRRLLAEISKAVRPFCIEPETIETDVERIAREMPKMKLLAARSSQCMGTWGTSCYRARMGLQLIYEYRVNGHVVAKCGLGGVLGNPPGVGGADGDQN